MENSNELIERYKNDMMKMMKRSYFPYDESVNEQTQNEEIPTNSNEAENIDSTAEDNTNSFSTPNESDNLKGGYGSLKVRAFSGNIAFPVQTAFVRIFDGDDRVVREGYTNQSGIFDAEMLPAPSRIISESPGNEKGYTGYGIIVTHPRFNTEIFENVPVFSDVESIQDVRMQPGSEDESELTVESEPDDLRGGSNA